MSKKIGPMEEKSDVVIVGCGMAGSIAGLTAAREGLKVCILERKKKEFIGQKICGELMPLQMITWLRNEFDITADHYPLKGLEFSTLSEHTAVFRSPSQHRLQVREPLCTIDRWKFGQLLVRKLEEKGVHVYKGIVKSPVIGNGCKGVKTKDSRTFLGTVTIDCSGINSILHKSVSSYAIPSEKYVVAYKEELVLENPIQLDYAVIFMDKKAIPSGYMWCFPKSEYTLNIGIGGVTIDKGSLKALLHKNLQIHKAITVKERRKTGFGILPSGNPLPSMVYPGLLVCGDAASQVNPLTGEGIAPAMTAGYYAGTTAAQAVKNNDVSVKRMWQYNYDFAAKYGVIITPLQVLKELLLSLSGEELAFLMEKVVTSKDLEGLETGDAAISWKRAIRLLTHWRRLPLLFRVYEAFKRMDKIRALYEQYPQTPDRFSAWEKELNSCLG